MAGTSKSGNEPLGCIKCWEFLDLLRAVQILKKEYAVSSKNCTFKVCNKILRINL